MVVGSNYGKTSSREPVTWTLPEALLSYHSRAVAEACRRPLREDLQTRITFPAEDPNIFQLFVEFIYYGSYSNHQHSNADSTGPNLYAQAWVLGDTLRSSNFKNYAIGQIHAGIMDITSLVVTPQDIAYICENNTPCSKICQFFFAYTSLHFSDSVRVTGAVEAWDRVLQEHAALRSYLIRRLRRGASQHQPTKELEMYIVIDEDEPSVGGGNGNKSSSVLGKRDADGLPVKRESFAE